MVRKVFNSFYSLVLLLSVCITPLIVRSQTYVSPEAHLKRLLKVIPEDRTTPAGDQLPGTPPAHVSPDDFLWRDWLKSSGELPPDFAKIPALPFLPNPLIIDEGGKDIPVKTYRQWLLKRKEMTELAQHWITGTVPPPPGNIVVRDLGEKTIDGVRERNVLLKFGPDHQAQLHVNLLFPPGEGPFSVFLCPWKKGNESWVQAVIRRGYIACRFTATDPKYGYPDDSEAYENLWWPEYNFSAIMRWGWAASRAIDYLYTLDNVSRDQIGLAGLSRNGKMSLWAAAFDERIKAVVPISGGTGGEDPFRYTTDKYSNETVSLLTWVRPHWLHERLPFFIGMESRMPVDQNSLMALIAPRGLMITSSITEGAGNPWGIEQAFLSAKKAYDFLGASDKIALDLRFGFHSPSSRDIERYLDFFDYIFGRGGPKPESKLVYDYSFSKWLGLSGEKIDPANFPVKDNSDLLLDSQGRQINSISGWEAKTPEIQRRIKWGLGEEPLSIGPGNQTDYLQDVVGLPRVSKDISSKSLLFGKIYFPRGKDPESADRNLPVIIWLHEYSYNMGMAKSGDIINRFIEAGYCVYTADQIGFGTRAIEESRLFYNRFPKWSKMGRMVSDVRWAVDALSDAGFIDTGRIYVAGYSLGATVALYSAALDQRIAGVISVCGFSPMRFNTPGKTAEGIYEYSHLHGLIPRLGFFIGNERQIPYDFHEILASIAPRPLMIVAPTWDQYASFSDVENCINEVRKVYTLFNHEDRLKFYTPEDYNRFSDEMRNEVIKWATANFQ